jgi:hypothetical protein
MADLNPMNQSQRKYLKHRLDAAISAKRYKARSNVDKRYVSTAAIRDAERLLKRHRNAAYREREKADKRIRKLGERVRQELLFGTPESALRAVQKFEKLKV